MSPSRPELVRFDPPRARALVLFAVGRGGRPERHLPLLEALSARGARVLAPAFDMLAAPSPSAEELIQRAERLAAAARDAAEPGLPLVGVGHSIGATLLLALAGATPWLRTGTPVAIAPEPRLTRLCLLAPATDFFRAPGALAGVNVPLAVWAGSADSITPPVQAELLQHALGASVPVALHVARGAGHFSFMHTPPPGTHEPLSDRDAFLAELVREVCDAALA